MSIPQPGYKSTEDFALALDDADPLRAFRTRFLIPQFSGADSVYLCGHSLGLQPKTTAHYIQQELNDWAELGVEGHFQAQNPWMPYHRLLTDKTAELVGAKPVEVVVMNSLTVNLHLMMVSFYRPTKKRYKILVERGAFPSDQYAVQSQIHFHGLDTATSLIEMTPRSGESCIREEDIELVIRREGEQIALVMLGGVNYATGQAFDMARITQTGHAHGCVVGFDLAHAAGNLQLNLHDWGCDFAVWCSYKYLNGGPGCVAGCFVHDRHAERFDLPRFAGWWGHNEQVRFQMGPTFHPMAGADGWQLSNPSILGLAALRASMDMYEEAGIHRLRDKSVALTGYLEYLLDEETSSAFSLITPREEGRRGAQLSLRVPRNGKMIRDRLAHEGVIADWREPDTFRVAPVPLYNSYLDVYRFVKRFVAAVG